MISKPTKEEEFKLDKEKYEKRPDSFHQWRKNNLKNYDKKKAQTALDNEKNSKEAAAKMKVGMRFQTKPDMNKGNKHRGTVKWIGKLPNKEVTHAGCELDEPYGK